MESSGHVSWFADIGLHDRPHVGGKGGSLGELQRAGISVPPGFVVRTEAFERFLEALERESSIRSQIESLSPDDLEGIRACSKAIRQRVEEAALPSDVLEEVSRAHATLCSAFAGAEAAGAGAAPQAGIPAVAVRSSATTEDASDASFAGLQDTYLWVRDANETVRKVRSCWASLYSVESISYRRKRAFPEAGVAMAVVVQVMVDARTAGVMFTRSPTSGDRSVVTIEGAWGLGSAVVGGEVTPDRWVLGKITGEVSVREISDKMIQHVPVPQGGIEAIPVPEDLRRSPCLADEELQALRAVARQVEKHYGHAQDIEWAVDRHTGEILLLQSRPETVWSAKDSAPVARAADNPLSHVMSIFGGRR
jgi:pyruvate, water dikinase